jgi:subfamily B ATP-binding cassette protein HlyB/CyaB
MVGERGSTLSGGQKQRIAIARALITNPRILIFDEATSALDYESEKIIHQNLGRITTGRTTFIVAHRLSAVRDCDLIVALDGGKIIETGTHNVLMEKKGYYHFLCTQQEATVV